MAVVITTSTVPAEFAGVVQEILVEVDVQVTATPPKDTWVIPVMFVPVIVTGVFPVDGPEDGVIFETVTLV